jgi:hypothetical protein
VDPRITVIVQLVDISPTETNRSRRPAASELAAALDCLLLWLLLTKLACSPWTYLPLRTLLQTAAVLETDNVWLPEKEEANSRASYLSQHGQL